MSGWSPKRTSTLCCTMACSTEVKLTSRSGTSSALVNLMTAPPAATMMALPLPMGTMDGTPFLAVLTTTLGSGVTPNGNQRITTCPSSCAKLGERLRDAAAAAGRRAESLMKVNSSAACSSVSLPLLASNGLAEPLAAMGHVIVIHSDTSRFDYLVTL
eukprot:6213468-Pleurochrysis_carterae.AAC.2